MFVYLLTKWLNLMVKKKLELSTEDKIIAAARKVFLKKGIDGARMQEIADEAGINKAMLHYYFRSKDKLFEFIFQETASKLFPHFEAVLDSNLDIFEKIRQVVKGYIDIIAENPFLILFVMNAINSDAGVSINESLVKQKPKFFSRFVEEMEKSAKKGLIKKVDAQNVLINLLAMCAFPFIAKPMIAGMLSINEKKYAQLIEKRKTEVADFIIAAIKK